MVSKGFCVSRRFLSKAKVATSKSLPSNQAFDSASKRVRRVKLWENMGWRGGGEGMSDSELLDEISKVAGDRAKVMDLVLAHFNADTGTIHVLGPDGLLHLEAWAGGIPEPLLDVIRTIPVGKGIAGLAVQRREPVNLCNLQTDQSGDVRPGARATGVHGSICVPIMAGPAAVGALGIATRRERDFTGDEAELLQEVGRVLVT